MSQSILRRAMALSLAIASVPSLLAAADSLTVQPTPEDGIQPQLAVDAEGSLHLIYFAGKPAGGDLFYVRSEDSGTTFSRPLRVNTQEGSAIAMGNIRGAHLAIGKGGRPHVAWMGSAATAPGGDHHRAPMLYTRLDDAGNAFERERNVIQAAFGLDGGGSVAADDQGNVYVSWHAPAPGTTGEGNRRVWVVSSSDEGATFEAEKPVSPERLGVCGCCGMRAFCDQEGNLAILFRSARLGVNRDTYLLISGDRGDTSEAIKLHEWNIGTCPMSSFALAENGTELLAAWETDGQVYYARIDPKSATASAPITAPGAGKGRKHPVVATNDQGQVAFAWTEGMGWQRGGSLAWQVFDAQDQPTPDKGQARGVPVWSLLSVFADADGNFHVVR